MSGDEISLVDAAAILKKTWSQVWQLVLTGTIEGRKKEGKWLVSQRSLREYQARNRNSDDDARVAHTAA